MNAIVRPRDLSPEQKRALGNTLFEGSVSSGSGELSLMLDELERTVSGPFVLGARIRPYAMVRWYHLPEGVLRVALHS